MNIEKLNAIQEEAKRGGWTQDKIYDKLKECGISELDLDEMDKATGGGDFISAIFDYSKYREEKHIFIEGFEAGYDKSWAVENAKERYKNSHVQQDVLKEIDEIWSKREE